MASPRLKAISALLIGFVLALMVTPVLRQTTKSPKMKSSCNGSLTLGDLWIVWKASDTAPELGVFARLRKVLMVSFTSLLIDRRPGKRQTPSIA